MYCINCGTKLPDGARFCSECGAPTGASASGKATGGREDSARADAYVAPELEEAPIGEATTDDDMKGDTLEEAIDAPREDAGADTYASADDNRSEKTRTTGYSGSYGGARNDYSAYTERRANGNMHSSLIYDTPIFSERSTGIAILSFILPLIGLILWLAWKDSKPGKAMSAAKGALVAVSVGVPLAGLILWVVMKDSGSELAKPCGIGAIVGAVLALLLPFIMIFALVVYSLVFEMGGYYVAALIPSIL